ncbi:growth/differentiation factor 6-B-like [Sparus aurata]|uniref:Growth/differentiation factor 6-B-like n=1 Tax=Sparus aurata TaxID=8175 RepID=A0A671V6L4_SPAAU|nr:growth/differentiation factor 6-B-like [Sparus aurata]
MSLTFTVLTMLLGVSVVTAFVLQSSEQEPAASANSPVSHHRCQVESLESIRKALLSSLGLQVEPQLPAGGLTAVREQWTRTYNNIAHKAKDTAIPAVSGYSVSHDDENSTSLKCCSMASEIFMRDLGWDSWVIYPISLTVVQCAICNLEANTVQCPSSDINVQDSQVPVPCCNPISHITVPVVYMDEFSTIVISSVQLTSSCGCGHSNIQLPSEE